MSRPSRDNLIIIAVVVAIITAALLVRFHVFADHSACKPPMHVVHAPDGSYDCV